MIHQTDGNGRIVQSTKRRLGVVVALPIGPVGIPEATTVLCGGNGELIRALALGLAVLSMLIIFRTGYRVARSAIGSATDSVTSLMAGVLPGLYLLWLTLAGADVLGCLFTESILYQFGQFFDSFMTIGIAIVHAIGSLP